MRTIGGFIRSSTIHVMESELSLPPLYIRRYYLASKFWLKSKSYSNNIATEKVNQLAIIIRNPYWRHKKKPLLIIVREFLENIPMNVSNQLELFTMDTWSSNVDLSNIMCLYVEGIQESKKRYDNHVLRETCEQFLTLQYPDCYYIYTDGSKHTNGVGSAIYDPQTNGCIKLQINNNISVMHIELVAIAEAIAYIKSFQSGNFVICTDFRSALQYLARCTSNFGAPIAILQSVNKLATLNLKIYFQWVPSHIGLRGNELVDCLAKEAATDGIIYTCLPFHTDCLTVARSKCKDLWKQHFDERSLSKGIWYKTIQPNLSQVPWFRGSGLGRKYIVTALRLRSGHIPLNSFAFLMGNSDTPNCMDCGAKEDALHIMVECVRNEVERDFLMRNNVNIFEIGICNTILAHPLSKIAKELYKIVNIGINRR